VQGDEMSVEVTHRPFAEIFMERQLHLTGGEYHLWPLENSKQASFAKSICLLFKRLLIGPR